MRRLLAYVWGTVAVIALWWACALLLNTPALPAPDATFPALAACLPEIAPELGISFLRIVLAMALGTVLGAPLGMWLGRSERANRVLSPVLYVLYPIPKIVFLPVLFILLGLGGQAKVVLMAIVVFFQMLVSMRDAAAGVPEDAATSLRSLGATRWQVFKEAVVPATVPALFTALRVTTAMTVAILFIAESMAGSSGLGYYIMHSWSLLEYEQMFAGIVVLSVLGVAIYEAFEAIEYRLLRWKRA